MFLKNVVLFLKILTTMSKKKIKILFKRQFKVELYIQ